MPIAVTTKFAGNLVVPSLIEPEVLRRREPLNHPGVMEDTLYFRMKSRTNAACSRGAWVSQEQ
jgi:hypothetical protein